MKCFRANQLARMHFLRNLFCARNAFEWQFGNITSGKSVSGSRSDRRGSRSDRRFAILDRESTAVRASDPRNHDLRSWIANRPRFASATPATTIYPPKWRGKAGVRVLDPPKRPPLPHAYPFPVSISILLYYRVNLDKSGILDKFGPKPKTGFWGYPQNQPPKPGFDDPQNHPSKTMPKLESRRLPTNHS